MCVCARSEEGRPGLLFCHGYTRSKTLLFFLLWDDEKVLKPERKTRARVVYLIKKSSIFSLFLSAHGKNQAFGVMV